MKLDFWFEFASTYSYPTVMRIEELAAARGVELSWRAFLLGPIFKEQGWDDSPFNLYPAKGRYMWRDLNRICEGQGIRFQHPSTFPRNGLLAARVACQFATAPWIGDFVRAVYTANFAEDREIADPETIADCLSALGEDPATILEAAASDAAKGALRVQSKEAKDLGIFGAPSFSVKGELFWGNDRLEQALDWAEDPA